MTIEDTIKVIEADLYRYKGKKGISNFIAQLFFGIGQRYMIWLRLENHFRNNGALYLPFRVICQLFRIRYRTKFGIDIPPGTLIGSGFYIGHFGGIFVSGGCVIGKNCNVSQDVTIGVGYQNGVAGYPVIGDNVYIGPGAKVFGSIQIGNNVAIGANCVVNKDVPDGAVVVGVPAKVVSFNSSKQYINFTDY